MNKPMTTEEARKTEARDAIRTCGNREAAIAYHEQAYKDYLALTVKLFQEGQIDLARAAMVAQAQHARIMGKLRAL